jgi:hypothetical protein
MLDLLAELHDIIASQLDKRDLWTLFKVPRLFRRNNSIQKPGFQHPYSETRVPRKPLWVGCDAE